MPKVPWGNKSIPDYTAHLVGDTRLFSLRAGTLFGPRYRVVGFLGEDPLGVVYKAFDEELRRIVALRIVRPEHGASAVSEVLLSSRISHKNIPLVYEFGEIGGVKFIAMQYVEGENLSQLMAIGRLPLERVLSFARQLLSALDAAHSEGVVYEDLKPSNILIDESGNLFVMAFGAAGSIEAQAHARIIRGTLDYMAPEVFEGKTIDHRANIYSFGLILYEMVTGALPFKGETAYQLMYLQRNERPADPRVVCPTVRRYLARIILKCLEKDPEKRYQSAREISDDLDAKRFRRSLADLADILTEDSRTHGSFWHLTNVMRSLVSVHSLFPPKRYFRPGRFYRPRPGVKEALARDFQQIANVSLWVRRITDVRSQGSS